MLAQLRHFAMLSAFAVIMISANGASASASSPDYKLASTLHLPGSTRWDFIAFDPDHRRLYITRGESVDVLDIATQKIAGSITDLNGTHGIALASALNVGFVSNGKANNTTIFDLTSLQPIATIPTGNKPDAIVYDPATQLAYVADADSDDVTVIDAKKKEVSGTIKLDGDPEFMALDGAGHLYVNLENKSQIAVVDTKTLKVLTNYNLAPNCEGPTGLSIDVSKNRLFASCANKVMLVVDATAGKIIDTLPIGDHSDATLFDPATKLVFSSNGDGTLTVIGASRADHYSVLQTAKTMTTARTMALDPATHQIYLVAAETEGFDPPNEKHPTPRPHIKPDTFMVLTVTPTTKNKTGH